MLQSGQYCLYPCKISKDQTGHPRLFMIWMRITHDAVSCIGSQCHHTTSWGLYLPLAAGVTSHLIVGWVLQALTCLASANKAKDTCLSVGKHCVFPLMYDALGHNIVLYKYCSLIKALLWLILKPADPEVSTALLSLCSGAVLQEAWLRAAKCCKNFLPKQVQLKLRLFLPWIGTSLGAQCAFSFLLLPLGDFIGCCLRWSLYPPLPDAQTTAVLKGCSSHHPGCPPLCPRAGLYHWSDKRYLKINLFL